MKWATLLLFFCIVAHAQWTGRRINDFVVPQQQSFFQQDGAVKLIVSVDAKGNVIGIEVKGGHPVLVESATAAVVKWKFGISPIATTERIKIIWRKDSIKWEKW